MVQDGQILADLTDGIATFAASLRHDVSTKSWQLEVEIGGMIIPTDIHVPLFAPTAGARLAALQVGDGLEHLVAGIRKGSVIF